MEWLKFIRTKVRRVKLEDLLSQLGSEEGRNWALVKLAKTISVPKKYIGSVDAFLQDPVRFDLNTYVHFLVDTDRASQAVDFLLGRKELIRAVSIADGYDSKLAKQIKKQIYDGALEKKDFYTAKEYMPEDCLDELVGVLLANSSDRLSDRNSISDIARFLDSHHQTKRAIQLLEENNLLAELASFYLMRKKDKSSALECYLRLAEKDKQNETPPHDWKMAANLAENNGRKDLAALFYIKAGDGRAAIGLAGYEKCDFNLADKILSLMQSLNPAMAKWVIAEKRTFGESPDPVNIYWKSKYLDLLEKDDIAQAVGWALCYHFIPDKNARLLRYYPQLLQQPEIKTEVCLFCCSFSGTERVRLSLIKEVYTHFLKENAELAKRLLAEGFHFAEEKYAGENNPEEKRDLAYACGYFSKELGLAIKAEQYYREVILHFEKKGDFKQALEHAKNLGNQELMTIYSLLSKRQTLNSPRR